MSCMSTFTSILLLKFVFLKGSVYLARTAFYGFCYFAITWQNSKLWQNSIFCHNLLWQNIASYGMGIFIGQDTTGNLKIPKPNSCLNYVLTLLPTLMLTTLEAKMLTKQVNK